MNTYTEFLVPKGQTRLMMDKDMGRNLMITFAPTIPFKICHYFLKLRVNLILVTKASRLKIESQFCPYC